MTPQTRYISRYEIQSRLGKGGMGVLYLARDPHIDRLVAVKLLHGEFADDDLRRRFVLEAKAAGGLSHPNIVTVHDFGEYDGAPFIVMEYVRGDTLAAVIARGTPISLVQKLEWMEQVCAGLSHAHSVGIIHRDIKPSNLMVDQHSRMKILDFGIARLTGTGPVMMSMVVGTPGYMSPEQIQGGMIDPRSDVFSLGAVLYELLASRPAFPGENPHTIMHRVLNSTPAPLTPYLGDQDSSIIEVVNTALAKNVPDRYANMAAFQAAIARSRIMLETLSSAETRATPIPTIATVREPLQQTDHTPLESARPWVSTPAPQASVVARMATDPTSSIPVASPAPGSSAPVSGAPVSATPISAAPISAAPISAAPVSVTPVSNVPVSAPLPVAAAPAAFTPLTDQPSPATTRRQISPRAVMIVAAVAIALAAVVVVLPRLMSSGGSDLLDSSGTGDVLQSSQARVAGFVQLMAAVAMSPPALDIDETPAAGDASSLVARAAAAEADGNLAQAAVHYSAVLRLDPGNVQAQQGMARIRAERHNTADRLVRRANMLFEAADYDAAVRDLNRALEADPGHREATALLERVRLARAAEAKRRRVP